MVRCAVKIGLGVLRREILSALRRSGLHQQRPALRRPRRVERPAHPEPSPVVVDGVHLRRDRRTPRSRRRGRRASSSQLSHSAVATSTNSAARSYRPRWSGTSSRPKLAASSAPAEVTMFQPARPPLMWSSEANCGQGVRLVVAGGRGGDQADVLGGGRDRRQQRDRLEDRLGVVLDPRPDRETVGEEHRIQLASFGDSREFLEVPDVAECCCASVRGWRHAASWWPTPIRNALRWNLP